MGTTTPAPRDWREWRRFRAWELEPRGRSQHDIAVALGVTSGAVSQWIRAGEEGGSESLRSHPSPGHPAKLTLSQRRQIPDVLWHGAEAYGFRGDVWTGPRVAQVIEWEFGIRYHRDHVSRRSKDLGWTPQIPITRAIPRDEAAIARRRMDGWPEWRRRATREHRTLVCVEESGFYLLPGLVRTYGPKGRTPATGKTLTRDHLSVMAGVTPAGKRDTLVRQKSLKSPESAVVLRHVLVQTGQELLVIWDGSPIHRWGAVPEFMAEGGAKRIHSEGMPGYAPDRSPLDQGCWHHLKHVEMRNLSCMDMEELHLEFHLAVGRLRQKPHLIRSLFAAAGLSTGGEKV